MIPSRDLKHADLHQGIYWERIYRTLNSMWTQNRFWHLDYRRKQIATGSKRVWQCGRLWLEEELNKSVSLRDSEKLLLTLMAWTTEGHLMFLSFSLQASQNILCVKNIKRAVLRFWCEEQVQYKKHTADRESRQNRRRQRSRRRSGK